MQEARQALLNAYLDLSRESQDLRDMAYAKGVLWVLLAESRPLVADEISSGLGQLVGASSIPKLALDSALKLLVQHKHVLEKAGSYSISPAQETEMKRKIEYSTTVTEQILKQRFPQKIELAKLKSWFDDVNSSYFCASADQLIALYSQKAKPVFNVESVLRPIIKKHGLQSYEGELLQGYREFLTSGVREEEEKVFYLISSILSSRLVAANISPDALSIDKYRGSEMLIDTNVLFAMRLNRGGDLLKAFDAFGAVASSLGIKLSIAKFSADEYERVRARERESFLLLASSYSKTVLDGLNKNNYFVKAMAELGCETHGDIERFFDVTLQLPMAIGSHKLELLEGKQLRGGLYIEELDKDLLATIRKETSKSEHTAIHDLQLTKLATVKSKSRRTYVLTIDSQMEAFALRRVGEKEEPLWLSLYSLVQILALNGGGPAFNPAEIAPLIRIFIEFEESTNAEQYDERDLLLLLEKTDRVNEIPETQLISLLNKLHRVKLERSPEEAVRQVTLELDRALRQNAVTKDEAVRNKQETIDSLTAQQAQTDRVLGDTQRELVGSKKNGIWTWFAIRAIVYIAFAALILWLIRSEILEDFAQNRTFDLLSKAGMIIGVLLFAVTDYLNYVRPKLREIGTD